MTTRVIVDTSVIVGLEQDRELARPIPEDVGVSVVTLAELELGVLMARDPETRSTRLATLTRIRDQTSGLPIDQEVASAYARLAATQLEAGRRPRIQDTWIAATAAANDAEVWTQDEDFGAFAGVTVVRV